jgi:hypothetical protein
MSIGDIYLFKGKFYLIRAYLTESILVCSPGNFFNDVKTTVGRTFVDEADLTRWGLKVGSKDRGFDKEAAEFFPVIKVEDDGRIGVREENYEWKFKFTSSYMVHAYKTSSSSFPLVEYEMKRGHEVMNSKESMKFSNERRIYVLEKTLDDVD